MCVCCHIQFSVSVYSFLLIFLQFILFPKFNKAVLNHIKLLFSKVEWIWMNRLIIILTSSWLSNFFFVPNVKFYLRNMKIYWWNCLFAHWGFFPYCHLFKSFFFMKPFHIAHLANCLQAWSLTLLPKFREMQCVRFILICSETQIVFFPAVMFGWGFWVAHRW